MTNINEKSLMKSLKKPLLNFIHLEASGGFVLMFFTFLALVLANSNVSSEFFSFWEQKVGLELGTGSLIKTLLHWINDGLMAVFFFVVGLEIKREILTGGLSSVKKASLPIFAAIGGMLVPAAIYFAINYSHDTVIGWGIPMATDIAFALGIMIMLGKKVPLALKLLLTSLAIVDDIGAVLVIAFFYTSQIIWSYVVVALLAFLALCLFNYKKYRSIPLYMVFGFILWFALLKSGIHATLAGILLAITIPAKSKINLKSFIGDNKKLLKKIVKREDYKTSADYEANTQSVIGSIKDNCKQVISPLQYLEHLLHPWVAFLIVPIFAFANAGVQIDGDLISHISDPAALGIIAGLFIGKPLGIFMFSKLACLLGWASKADEISWVQIIGIGFLGGIGFTMSFFVSQLAFDSDLVLNVAKLAVLIASFLSSMVGFIILYSFAKKNKAK